MQEAGRRLGGDKRLWRTPPPSSRREGDDDGRSVADNFNLIEVERPTTAPTARRAARPKPRPRSDSGRDQPRLRHRLPLLALNASRHVSTVIAVKLSPKPHRTLPSSYCRTARSPWHAAELG